MLGDDYMHETLSGVAVYGGSIISTSWSWSSPAMSTIIFILIDDNDDADDGNNDDADECAAVCL